MRKMRCENVRFPGTAIAEADSMKYRPEILTDDQVISQEELLLLSLHFSQ